MIPIIGVIIGITTVAAAPAEFYESRYDHLDVESVLNNRRMVNYYAACLLSKGPCPPQGVELKQLLPEVLATNCARCSEKQKVSAYRSVKRLKKEYPKIWAQLVAVWDPNDTYVRTFEASFEDQNSVIPPPSQPPVLFNRFGDTDNADANSAASVTPSTTSTSTTVRTTTTSTSTTTAKPTNKPTNNPPLSVTRPQFVITKPPQAPPFTTVGANLQATVSFGTNLVGGIVRSLGTLGSKVVESGTKLANMVISAALRT